jgi:MFS family permease
VLLHPKEIPMSKRQLVVLFLVGVAGYTIGNGLIPLLPVYAKRLGASADLVGYYLAFSYAAIAAGTIAGGWLADKLDRRKPILFAAGLVVVPSLWLMGMASSLWQLAALTAVVWLMFGVGGTQINILAGLFAEPSQRGKVFGILGLTPGIGSLLGGLTIGFLADTWGYGTLFVTLAAFFALWPLFALLAEDKKAVVTKVGGTSADRAKTTLPRAFFLLLLSSTVVFVGFFGQVLGRSLAMNDLGFSATAITSTQAISGAVGLPLPLVLGLLSDRFGRKRALILSYLFAVAGLLTLAVATDYWHFALAASLIAALLASSAVGSALTRDLIPKEGIGRGMAAFNATTWVGGILGFAVAGRAVQSWGMTTTFVLAALLPLLGMILLTPIRESTRAAQPSVIPE